MQAFYFRLIRSTSRDEGLLFIKKSMGVGDRPTRGLLPGGSNNKNFVKYSMPPHQKSVKTFYMA